MRWAWLNFHYEPWEAERSPYFGATLAAIAIHTAPGGYAARPENQERLKLLRDYLRRGATTQHLFNRLTVLWASSRWPGLLTPEEQQSIVEAARRAQQDDGGWSVAAFADWKRVDGSALDTHSDGYGTGLAALALQYGRRAAHRSAAAARPRLAGAQSGRVDRPLERRVAEQESRSRVGSRTNSWATRRPPSRCSR